MKAPLPSLRAIRFNPKKSAGIMSESELFDQKTFLRLLCLERKRTERSGRPFVLMLLEVGQLLKAGKDRKILDKTLLALASSTRDTDTKGWYETNHVVGVIFTEINNATGNAVARALLSRVTAALGSTLAIEDINAIRLSFHIYPEHPGDGGETTSDPYLYPDCWPGEDGKNRALKRSMDIVGSLAALTVSAPVLLLIAAAIKLTSRGPILFRQQRVGQHGRQFTFLKFRSMSVSNDETAHKAFMKTFIAGKTDGEAETNGDAVFKITKDPRITPIGSLLRKTSLDEFPQFVNVLLGEMSLVGPRPAIPYEVACYDTWHRQRLLNVKPGITGLWQVTGRSRTQFADMVRLDVQYAESWTPWMDLKILLKTPGAVIFGDGAY